MASNAKVTDNGWDKFKKTLRQLGDMEVVVGVPGAIDFSTPTVAAIGTIHEFGSADGTIPSRSFLRSTFDINKAKYDKLLRKYAEGVAKSKKVDAKALFVVGETTRTDVINRIRQKEIPQDPRGLANKPDGTALVDTGNLVDSIISQVRKREGK